MQAGHPAHNMTASRISNPKLPHFTQRPTPRPNQNCDANAAAITQTAKSFHDPGAQGVSGFGVDFTGRMLCSVKRRVIKQKESEMLTNLD